MILVAGKEIQYNEVPLHFGRSRQETRLFTRSLFKRLKTGISILLDAFRRYLAN